MTAPSKVYRLSLFYLIGVLFGIALAWAGARTMRYFAVRLGLMDIPNARSSHSAPIPRAGGIVIVLITLSGFILYWSMQQDVNWRVFWGYLLSSTMIAIVGLVDDFHPLKYQIRLLVQVIAAIAFTTLVDSLLIIRLPIWGKLELGWFGYIITIIWLVWMTNAFNFMDGIDGLVGSISVIVGICWIVFALLHQIHIVCFLSVFIAIGSFGFLIHNWPPAKIFLGDTGSTFIGFTLASITVTANRFEPRAFAFAALVYWPFILDTAFTLCRRLYHRENVFRAHRSHLYQRLLIAGFKAYNIDLLYIVFSSLGALIYLFLWDSNFVSIMILFGQFVLSLLFIIFVQQVEQRFQRHNRRAGTNNPQQISPRDLEI